MSVQKFIFDASIQVYSMTELNNQHPNMYNTDKMTSILDQDGKKKRSERLYPTIRVKTSSDRSGFLQDDDVSVERA